MSTSPQHILLVDRPISVIQAAMHPAWEAQLPTVERKPAVFGDEAVKAEGLDPAVYCGVGWADLAVADTINLNERIYPRAEFVANNKAFNDRIQGNAPDRSNFAAGERNHPGYFSRDMGISSLNTNGIKWLEVTVVEEAGKIPLARGRYAFLKTQAGQDLAILYQAGQRLGLSARAYGTVEKVQITADSPYWYVEANRRYVGAWVDVIRDWSMGVDGTYDVVDVPAAGAWLDSVGPEVRDAYNRIQDCRCGKEIHMSNPTPSAATLTAEQAAVLIGNEVQKAQANHWSAKVDAKTAAIFQAHSDNPTALQAALADSLGLTATVKQLKTDADAAKARADAAEAKLAKLEFDAKITAKIDAVAKAAVGYETTVRDVLFGLHSANPFAAETAVDSVAEKLLAGLKGVERSNPASDASNKVPTGAAVPSDVKTDDAATSTPTPAPAPVVDAHAWADRALFG